MKPPIGLQPVLFLIKVHYYYFITGPNILSFLKSCGLPDWYLAPVLHYFASHHHLTIRKSSPFFSSLSRLNISNLLPFLIHLIQYSRLFHCRHYILHRRIRSNLIRPTPTHLHFIKRFHSHPLPTRPPTPSLHNLLRNRLKRPPSPTPPSVPLITPHTYASYTYLPPLPPVASTSVPPKILFYGHSPLLLLPRAGVG